MASGPHSNKTHFKNRVSVPNLPEDLASVSLNEQLAHASHRHLPHTTATTATTATSPHHRDATLSALLALFKRLKQSAAVVNPS
jgi:hypothetical protein